MYMRKSRVGMRKRQRKINIVVIIFFFVILPITAVTIGSRITRWVVIPTINTENMLKAPEELDSENNGDVQKNNDEDNNDVQEDANNIVSEDEETNSEINMDTVTLNSLSTYMIQIASVSDNKNIEMLIEELNSYNFPSIVYRVDNLYKIYTFGATKREYIEGKLDQVREVYPDSYIGEMYVPQKEVRYSADEDSNVKEIVDSLNSLIQIIDKSSDNLYKYINEENGLEQYKETLLEHQNLLEQISEQISDSKLPEEFFSVDSIQSMIEYQEKNIAESLNIIKEEKDNFILQNYFLDNLFRTVELIKK